MSWIMRWLRLRLDDDDLVTNQRAWVLMLTDMAAILLVLGVLVISVWLRRMPVTGNILVTALAMLAGALASLSLLREGKYWIAAHITVLLLMSSLWRLNLVNAPEFDIKSDMSYVIAGLVLPAVLLGRWWTIAYGIISLVVVDYIGFMLARMGHALPDQVLGFVVDNSASIVFVVFFSSVISIIYEGVVKRVESLLNEQRNLNCILLELTSVLEQNDAQKRQFYRDTIYSVTNGKLSICDQSAVDAYTNSAEMKFGVPDASTASAARHALIGYCESNGLTGDRLTSFEDAVGEAIANAIKHGDGGDVYAGKTDSRVWAGVSDSGPGIESLLLPNAVLLRGYSTKPSLGIGYSVILEVSDQVLLKTSETGTTLIMIENIKDTAPRISLDSLPDTWESVASG